MSTVQNRHRQQVEHAETDTDYRHETQKRDDSHLRRITGHLRNLQGPADILDRYFAGHHARQNAKRQRRHPPGFRNGVWNRPEEHTSELQSLMRITYAAFGLNNKRKYTTTKI